MGDTIIVMVARMVIPMCTSEVVFGLSRSLQTCKPVLRKVVTKLLILTLLELLKLNLLTLTSLTNNKMRKLCRTLKLFELEGC